MAEIWSWFTLVFFVIIPVFLAGVSVGKAHGDMWIFSDWHRE